MAVRRCHTQLRLELTANQARIAQQAGETFVFHGKPFLAFIAPRYGCLVAVRADRHRATSRAIRAAFEAFKAENIDRITETCRDAWFNPDQQEAA